MNSVKSIKLFHLEGNWPNIHFDRPTFKGCLSLAEHQQNVLPHLGDARFASRWPISPVYRERKTMIPQCIAVAATSATIVGLPAYFYACTGCDYITDRLPEDPRQARRKSIRT